jgi:hypothetical protein
MSKDVSSADVLKKIWTKFERRVERDIGAKPSMRATSMKYLDGGDKLLTRWMTPGSRTNWRIPLSRVKDVCKKLKANAASTELLMWARLMEIARDDQENPVAVSALWAFDCCAAHNHGFSPDELRVMSAYREQAKKFPRGLSQTDGELEILGPVFVQLLQKAQDDQESQDGPLEDCTEEECTALREKALRVSEKLKEIRVNSAAQKAAKLKRPDRSVELQMKDYLRKLKDT